MEEYVTLGVPESPVYLPAEEVGTGSFERFGAPEVSFNQEYDVELIEKIENLSKKKGFPCGRKSTVALDHGTMVPLYFINKYYKNYNLVVVGLSDISLEANLEMGKIINEAVNKLDRKVVYVASGDLSHKLQVNGPYGFIEEGPIYDKRIIEVMSNARFKELLEFDLDFLDNAAECGHRSFIMMSGFLNNIKVKPKFYSHQDVTGVGYGICSYYPIDPYVELAKETIDEYIKTGKVIDIPTDLPEELTNTQQATFVSIHKNNDLRGCIGTIYPTRENTAKEIISNAISASTRDPRFNPITEDELNSLEINVDVLTLPESIEDKSKLDPKKYGVIVSTDTKRGVLLPDLEGVDSVEQQILIAKNKAGILPDEEIKLQRFEVIRHK